MKKFEYFLSNNYQPGNSIIKMNVLFLLKIAEKPMLPKFLIADNSQELPNTIFVIHTEAPRFIVESDIDDFSRDQVIHWIDEQPESEAVIEQLLEEAEDFLEAEFESQEDLYDDEFGLN